jgi:hypothetical protein
MTPVGGAHPYLLIERPIPASVLADLRFAGRIRIDVRGNAVFPHIDPPKRAFPFRSDAQSWFNQVECWFSILSRSALQGSKFTSDLDLVLRC